MKASLRALLALFLILAAASCGRSRQALASPPPSPPPSPLPLWPRLEEALKGLPPEIAGPILESREDFLADIAALSPADLELLPLVDKGHGLAPDFVPPGLQSLNDRGLSLSRADLSLRREALEALLEMDRAAREEGIILLLGSSYRSYDYQQGVWERNVAAYGEEQTAREVARPGHSQHQLGTAVDFCPIDDSFGETKASQWLALNAIKYGFSLSYPIGYEDITGYRHESWHFRYLGKGGAALQERWFGGIQHWLLLFLHGWKAGA